MSAFKRDKHHVRSYFPPVVLLPPGHWKGARVCVHWRGKLAREQQAEARRKWDGEYFVPTSEEGVGPTFHTAFCIKTQQNCKSYLRKVNTKKTTKQDLCSFIQGHVFLNYLSCVTLLIFEYRTSNLAAAIWIQNCK